MGDWRKSTLHMKVPASKRCTPVTLSADTEEEDPAAARRKWARSPNAVGSDQRSGRPLCDDSDAEGLEEAASRSLCRRES